MKMYIKFNVERVILKFQTVVYGKMSQSLSTAKRLNRLVRLKASHFSPSFSLVDAIAMIASLLYWYMAMVEARMS